MIDTGSDKKTDWSTVPINKDSPESENILLSIRLLDYLYLIISIHLHYLYVL